MTAPSPLDRWMPSSDVRERHEIVVRAPADVTLEAARTLRLTSIPVVRAIFWLRARAMGAKGEDWLGHGGFVDEALAAGWGVLEDSPGRLLVAGSVCQPWLADVVFRRVPPAEFPSYAEPDLVKIAWTLEAEPLAPDERGRARTRLVTETRAVGTDPDARRKFARYWRVVRTGIVAIRWFMLPEVKRQAERRSKQKESA
jgi:hypothetical protein